MLVKPQSTNMANIKVVGVGGAGGNAINTMIDSYDIDGVEFIAVNTDSQALAANNAEIKIQIGDELTRGLGSGGDPEVGRKAAEESVDLLHENLAGADMVFVTCGMGGGTGTGAAPVIAGIAKNLGALTVAIVEKPFNFEGKKRQATALQGISEIKEKVDTLIVIPNQRLLEVIEKNISFMEAMKKVDDILAQAVRSIAQLITEPGMINVDYADIKSIMQNAGTALMGMGVANGETRAIEATKQAMNSPLLEMSIDGAKGVLFNIVGSKNMSMMEIDAVASMISEAIDPDAEVIFGATIDQALKDELQVTILATGFSLDNAVKPVLSTAHHTSSKIHQKPTFASPTLSQKTFIKTNVSDAFDDNSEPNSTIDNVSDTKTLNKPAHKPSIKNNDIDYNDMETPSFLRRKKEY